MSRSRNRPLRLSRTLLTCAAACLLLAACNRGEPAPAGTGAAPTEPALVWEAEKGPVHVHLELIPSHPRLSDEPTLTLTIRAEEGVEVKPPPFGSSVGGFIIRDFREPLPEFRAGEQVLRQIYRLEPVTSGEVQILPVAVHFSDHRAGAAGESYEVVTDPQVVHVSSIVGDAPSLADLRPAAGPAPLPPAPLPVFWYYLGGGLIIAVVVSVWLLRVWPARKPAERRFTPTELAFQELQGLLQSNPLDRGDVKTYYVELTAIVRRYIERTTGVRAPEQTTVEFLRAVQTSADFLPEQKQRLRAFLEAADLVKFAAMRPAPEDVQTTLARTKEFVGLGNTPLGEAA